MTPLQKSRPKRSRWIRRSCAASSCLPLNADSGDAEFSALFEIAGMVGIEYDDDAEEYVHRK